MDYLANDVGNLALYIRNTKCPPKTSKAIEEKKNDDLNIYIALCNKGKINRDMTGWEKIHTISQSIQVVCQQAKGKVYRKANRKNWEKIITFFKTLKNLIEINEHNHFTNRVPVGIN